MREKNNLEFTLKHKTILALAVPLLFFILLEISLRLLRIEKLFLSDAQSIKLEMPAWMLKDANLARRATRIDEKKANIDWLNMFESGDGYRVRLIPGIERSVTNTFSLLDYDRKNKYLVKANSLGFRGPELTRIKPLNTYRILVFGDSSSYGWGVNQSEHFSPLLQRKLGEKIKSMKFEVGNFAIPGDSSEYGSLIVEKYLPQFEVDLVILGFGANDAKKTYINHMTQVEAFRTNSNIQGAKRFFSNFIIYRLMENLLLRQHADELPKRKVTAVREPRYTANLAKMADLAKQNGADTLLLNLCTPGNYARAARKLSEENNLLHFNGQLHLLNSIPEIQRGGLYPQLIEDMRENYLSELNKNSTLYVTSDGCHPNKLGHEIVSDQLAQIIGDHLSKN